jgi:hypothetical protein
MSGAVPGVNFTQGPAPGVDAMSGAVPGVNFTQGPAPGVDAMSGAVPGVNYSQDPASGESATTPVPSATPPDQESGSSPYLAISTSWDGRATPPNQGSGSGAYLGDMISIPVAPSKPQSNVNVVDAFTGRQPAEPFTDRQPRNPSTTDQNPDPNRPQSGSTFLDAGRYAGVFLNDLYAAPETTAATQSSTPRSDPAEGPQLRATDPRWVRAVEAASSVFPAPKQEEIFRETIRGPVLGAAAPGVATAIAAAAITDGMVSLAEGDYQEARSAFATALEVMPAASPKYLLTANQEMTMVIRESQAMLEREWLQASLREQRAAHTIQTSVASLPKVSPPTVLPKVSLPTVNFRYTPAMASDPVAANTMRFMMEWLQEGEQPLFRGVRRVTDDSMRQQARRELTAQGIDLTDRQAMHPIDAAADPLPYLEGDRRAMYMFGRSRTNLSFGGQLGWQLRRYGIRPGDAFHVSFTGFPSYEAVPPSFQSMPMWFQPLP